MSGGFELEAIPIFQEGIPEGFEYQLLPENWQQFGEYLFLKKWFYIIRENDLEYLCFLYSSCVVQCIRYTSRSLHMQACD